jgi:hypothetical protein
VIGRALGTATCVTWAGLAALKAASESAAGAIIAAIGAELRARLAATAVRTCAAGVAGALAIGSRIASSIAARAASFIRPMRHHRVAVIIARDSHLGWSSIAWRFTARLGSHGVEERAAVARVGSVRMRSAVLA